MTAALDTLRAWVHWVEEDPWRLGFAGALCFVVWMVGIWWVMHYLGQSRHDDDDASALR